MIRPSVAVCLVGLSLAGLVACVTDPVRQPTQVQLPDGDQKVSAGPAVRPKPTPTPSPKPTPVPSGSATPAPQPTVSASPSPSPTSSPTASPAASPSPL